MDEAEIQSAVNSLTCPGIEHILDPREAQDAATAVNDYLAAQIGRRPDRFGGFASVAMHEPEKGAAELSAASTCRLQGCAVQRLRPTAHRLQPRRPRRRAVHAAVGGGDGT